MLLRAERQQEGVTAAEKDCAVCALDRCSFREPVLDAVRKRGPHVLKIFPVERGDRIVGGAAACRRLWIVIKGLVVLATVLPDGRRQITDLSTPGDVVCPVGALTGTESWVEALGPSVLCQIDLTEVMQADGKTSDLMAHLFRHSHHQLERSNGNLVMLGRFDGMERIYQFLAEITRRIGVEGAGGHRVHLPMSREDIADYLGLNSETVSRLLSRVRKTKLITFISPTDFIVHDLEELERHLPNAQQPVSLLGRLFSGTRISPQTKPEASQ